MSQPLSHRTTVLCRLVPSVVLAAAGCGLGAGEAPPAATVATPAVAPAAQPAPATTTVPPPAVAVAPPVPAADTLTLVQAIALANERNETVPISRARIDQARSLITQAKSLLLPTLSANAGYNVYESSHRPFAKEPTQAGTVVLGAQLSLFDAQAWPGYSYAKRNLASTEFSAGELRRELAYSVAQSFISTIAGERALAAGESRLKVAQKAVADARARFNAGLAARGDVNRSELEAATAELSRTTAEQLLRTLRLNLANLIAAPLPKAIDLGFDTTRFLTPAAGDVGNDQRAALTTIEEDILGRIAETAPAPAATTTKRDTNDVPAGVSDVLVAIALAQRGDLRASEEALAAARELVTQASRADLPRLSVVGTWSHLAYSEGPGSTSNNPPEWRVALQASWAIWDGGLTSGRTDERAAQARERDLALKQARRGLRRDVESALVDLTSAAAGLRQVGVRVRVATANAVDVGARFREGLATALELADANSGQFEAEIEQVRQQLSLANAKLRLRQVLGWWPLGATETRAELTPAAGTAKP